MGKKLSGLILISVLIFSPILVFAQPPKSQIQISISATVQSQVPLVSTYPATNIWINQATLQGILTTLGPEEQVNVFFQYREKNLVEWQETPRETKTAPATFSRTIIGLSENTTYQFRAGVEWGEPLQQNFGDILEFTTSAAPPPPPPAPPPVETIVIFQGRAYPNAFLTLLKDGKVAATFFAEKSGLFEKKITGISGGIYTFGIFAEDTEGRKSVTLSFTVSILAGMITTISGIFISPTIEISPTQVEKGQVVNIFGQVFPKSQVNVFIASGEMVKETLADEKGKWRYKLDTGPLEEREHKARARAQVGEGEVSPFSQTLSFLILRKGALICKGADLNFDGKVNIIDFSILLYFWGQTSPENPCADINFDGIVNIIDFSIMMYWWTG